MLLPWNLGGKKVQMIRIPSLLDSLWWMVSEAAHWERTKTCHRLVGELAELERVLFSRHLWMMNNNEDEWSSCVCEIPKEEINDHTHWCSYSMQQELWCRAVDGPDTPGRGWAGIQRRLPGGVKGSEQSCGNCGRQPAGRKRGVSEGKHTEVEWLGVPRKLVSSGSGRETSGPSRWCLEAPSPDPDSSSPLGSNRSCPALKGLRGSSSGEPGTGVGVRGTLLRRLLRSQHSTPGTRALS